jgi:hypothetical protein
MPGESGVYLVTLDLEVVFATPTDPDDVFGLRGTLSTEHWAISETQEREAMGTGRTMHLTMATIGRVRGGTSVLAAFYPELTYSGDAPSYGFQAHMGMSYVAPAQVDPVVSSS